LKQRLLFLNILLLGLIVVAGGHLRRLILETERREQLVHNTRVEAPPAKTVPATPVVEKVQAASYFDIAQRLLFSRDRNPNVEITPPPPPPPVPPLPFLRGVLMIGGPPVAMLREAKGGSDRGYRPGEKIGEFTVAAISNSTGAARRSSRRSMNCRIRRERR
jgi:hypothetical protein